MRQKKIQVLAIYLFLCLFFHQYFSDFPFQGQQKKILTCQLPMLYMKPVAWPKGAKQWLLKEWPSQAVKNGTNLSCSDED